jgi:hypothetical protein
LNLLFGSLLIISAATNLWQFFYLKKNKKKLSTDARQLLNFLTNGGAVVKIEVIDPEGLMFYRGGK